MDEVDHPEIDQSEILNETEKKIYQSLIGALHWAITLARFDISVAVTRLSRFRAEPRQGHLKRVKRLCGYQRAHPEAAIRCRTKRPVNESHFGDMEEQDWQRSVYESSTRDEMIDVYPEPKGVACGQLLLKTQYLMHCLVTGKSLEGVPSFMNQTPVEWHCTLPHGNGAYHWSELDGCWVTISQ